MTDRGANPEPAIPPTVARGPGLLGALLNHDAAWVVAITLAAYAHLGRTMGVSPMIWEDTLIENHFVDECVAHGRCNAVGVGATIGIYHSAGYLHWRSLLQHLGFHANGTFLVFHACNALGVALVAVAAKRAGGVVAAVLAVALMIVNNGVPTQLNVISDVAPVPFLGAAFVLLAQTATLRPRLATTALMGMLAGVLLNFYATGLLCGLSAVLVALLIPQRRGAHATTAALSFALTAFVIAPLTWIVDARILFTRHVGHSPHIPHRAPFLHFQMVVWSTALLALWALLARWPALRRRLDVCVLVLVPLFVPVVIGRGLGNLDLQDKYFAHVLGAVAAGVGIGVATLGSLAFAQLTPRDPEAGAARRIADIVAWASCLALPAGAALLVHGLRWGIQGVDWGGPPPPTPTYGDLMAVTRLLGHDRGWSWARGSLYLRSPSEVVRRAAFRWASGWRSDGDASALERAYVLKVGSERLPAVLPVGTVVANRTPGNVVLVASTCSWIDWRSFRVCLRAAGSSEERCTESSLPQAPDRAMAYEAGIPGMPTHDGLGIGRQRLTLRFPLHPSEACPEMWVALPRIMTVCPGVIAGVQGEASEVDGRGDRQVRLRYDGNTHPAAPRELTVSWELGVPQCWNDFRGYPPFFVEGSPATTRFVTDLLSDQTTGDRIRW